MQNFATTMWEGTAAELAALNLVLDAGQFAKEVDQNPLKYKQGDGVTSYNSLPYFAAGGSGVTAFIQLSDVPNSYAGAAGKFVAVNGGETGLEFVNAPTGSGWAVTGTTTLTGNVTIDQNSKTLAFTNTNVFSVEDGSGNSFLFVDVGNQALNFGKGTPASSFGLSLQYTGAFLASLGDNGGFANHTQLIIDDFNQQVTIAAQKVFNFSDPATSDWLNINVNSGTSVYGKTDAKLTLDENATTLTIRALAGITVDATAGMNDLLTYTNNVADHAGVLTATLGNSPVAGDATLWASFSIGGHSYGFPLWQLP